MNIFKDYLQIVLVEPSHPGNIGAVARAMKTMGLSKLTLVNPRQFPDVQATAMAAGADDILANATLTNSLATAVAESHLILGTSARVRTLQLPSLLPRQAASMACTASPTQRIAILFGRENNGLSNAELELCNYQINIPTNLQFSSLNLAAAVQIISYEIHLAANQDISDSTILTNSELACSDELVQLYRHWEHLLLISGFFRQDNRASLIAKIKRLFNRAQLATSEVKILRGILSALEKKLS